VPFRFFNPNAFPVTATFESSSRDDGSDRQAWRLDREDGTSGSGTDESFPERKKLNALSSGAAWTWTGATRRRATVPSGGYASINASATFFAPGVFALDAYRILTRPARGDVSIGSVSSPAAASNAPVLVTCLQEVSEDSARVS